MTAPVPPWVHLADVPPPTDDEECGVSCGCWRCEGRPDDGTLHGTVAWMPDPEAPTGRPVGLLLVLAALLVLVLVVWRVTRP